MNIIRNVLVIACISTYAVAEADAKNTQSKNEFKDQKNPNNNVTPPMQVPGSPSSANVSSKENEIKSKEQARIKEQDNRLIRDLVSSRKLAKDEFDDEAHMMLLMYSGGPSIFKDTLKELVNMQFCVQNKISTPSSLHHELFNIIGEDDIRELLLRLRDRHIKYTSAPSGSAASSTLQSAAQQSWGQTLDGFQAPVGIALGAVVTLGAYKYLK